MGRYRSRSRSYSPRRNKRYDDARDSRSRRDRRSPAPSGLLVRNISLDARPEDLRTPFEQFGPIKDVYLPKDYYTGEPRGFGFVKFKYADDAAAAKEHLNCTVIGGREIRIVFAEENRKTPQDMRRISHTSSGRRSYRRRSPERSPRRHYRSYSRSLSPVRSDLRNQRGNDDYYSPRQSRSISRSRSPNVERSCGSPRHSGSMARSRSLRDERNYRSNNRSPSPKANDRNPRERDQAPSMSPSPRRGAHSPSRSHSQSYSPRR